MNSPFSKTLELIREEVELEGYEPGTYQFERVFLARRVKKCQELQGVVECMDCRAYLGCDLARQYMIDVKYGGNNDPDRR